MNVYVIHCAASGLTKIGFSTNVASRLRSLAMSAGARLSLVALFQGGRELETQLHRSMAESRRHGEWFELSAEQLASLRRGFSPTLDGFIEFEPSAQLWQDAQDVLSQCSQVSTAEHPSRDCPCGSCKSTFGEDYSRRERRGFDASAERLCREHQLTLKGVDVDCRFSWSRDLVRFTAERPPPMLWARRHAGYFDAFHVHAWMEDDGEWRIGKIELEAPSFGIPFDQDTLKGIQGFANRGR